MALKTLTDLMDEAKTLRSQDAQSAWVRGLSKYAPNDRSIRDMKNFVAGCEHPTWIDYLLIEHGIKFSISSDGTDSQGVAGLVVRTLNGLTAQEIRATDFSEFRDIARYLNNKQQRTLNAILNHIKEIIGHSE